MVGEDLLKNAITDGSYFSNPYPLFGELRKSAPVFYSPTLGGWIITRYAHVSEILHNHEDYSSKGRVLHLLSKLEPAVQERLPMLHSHFATGLAHTDAPEHKRLRGILAQAFTPKISENMRPITHEVVTRILKELRGDVDLISDLFTPVPALVVGRLLGSSESDIPHLIRWAGAINGLYEKGGNIDPQKAIFAEEMLHEIREFVIKLAGERRLLSKSGDLDPTVDVLSGLVNAEVHSDSLSESELVSTVVTLFVAGHETTTHLLGNGMLALLNQPESLNLLQLEPSLIPAAIDEMARFDGSVPRSWRITKRHMDVGGITIPQGELVLPMLSSANRDESVFENPDRFDIRRDTRKHLAFGRGVHVCLGAPLARIEGQEIIKEILLRFPNIALKDPTIELSWRKDVALRGLISLPVKL
ncbi:MAG: cytochrome P450 [Candidatus Planktophila sp.]|nr:cytochrome P450 [Candidatus Planktophila sp.]